jgi:hypothetical protein
MKNKGRQLTASAGMVVQPPLSGRGSVEPCKLKMLMTQRPLLSLPPFTAPYILGGCFLGGDDQTLRKLWGGRAPLSVPCARADFVDQRFPGRRGRASRIFVSIFASELLPPRVPLLKMLSRAASWQCMKFDMGRQCLLVGSPESSLQSYISWIFGFSYASNSVVAAPFLTRPVPSRIDCVFLARFTVTYLDIIVSSVFVGMYRGASE